MDLVSEKDEHAGSASLATSTLDLGGRARFPHFCGNGHDLGVRESQAGAQGIDLAHIIRQW